MSSMFSLVSDFRILEIKSDFFRKTNYSSTIILLVSIYLPPDINIRTQ